MQRLARGSLATIGLGLLAGCDFRLSPAPPARIYHIGYLTLASSGTFDEEFRRGLRDLGYVEGENIAIEHRTAEGSQDRLQELAAELVRLKVEVIVAATNPAISAAMQATRTIPIVMASGSDPVGNSFVASLARPGGNVTGLNNLSSELSGKRLEQLKEAFPGVLHVAVFKAAGAQEPQWRDAEVAARALGLQLLDLALGGPDDIERAFQTAIRERVDALLTLRNPITAAHRTQFVELAGQSGLPAMYPERGYVDIGGLMTFAPSDPDLYRRAAVYVNRILNGAKPADLPVELPTKWDFVLNLKTAAALGITFPQSILAQATEVIR